MLEQYISNDYLRAFTILVAFFFLIRLALFIFEKVTLKLTSKTKSTLDDKLLQSSSKPLTFLSLLIALRVTVTELHLEKNLDMILTNTLYSLMAISVAFLVYAIVNILIISGLKHITKKTKSTIDDSIISLFNSVLNISLIVICALYILSLWGIEIGPLLAGLGIAGLAVALALQPILSNVFSGASVVLDRTVRVGDLIYLDAQTKGEIDKIGLRSTRIKTFDNELIIVPNNMLAESKIQNVAQPEPKSRAVVPFSVAYGSEIAKVKKVVLEQLKQIEHVVDDPEPAVRFIEMGDSALLFKAYYYVDSFSNRFGTIDEANTRIYNALNKAGIEIPFPQMDVHVKK